MADNFELHRLRKENRALKKKLHSLEKSSGAAKPSPEKDGNCYSANNYFAYLLARIRGKSFYTSVYKFLKPSIWVTRIFRWLLILYQYIQAGAFVILYTAVFILIIPILLIITAITLIATLILRKRNADRLLERLKTDVVFIIPDGKDAFEKESLLKRCAEHSDSTVLVVSPFFLEKTGVTSDKEKMYVCYRKEAENVFILRNYFFFYFRKRLKKTHIHNVTEIKVFCNKED
ncbi:MAG: hypothetical protein IKU61_04970 [Clostridia bacterium]|nr:hypothetical protein [Clostridia bacterium]